MGYAFFFHSPCCFWMISRRQGGKCWCTQLHSHRSLHTFLSCLTVSWQARVEHEKPTNCNLTSGIKCLKIFLVLRLENHAGPFLFKWIGLIITFSDFFFLLCTVGIFAIEHYHHCSMIALQQFWKISRKSDHQHKVSHLSCLSLIFFFCPSSFGW